MKKEKIKYKTVTRDGQKFMICRNSNTENKYYKGTPCTNYELIGNTSIAVLCSSCVRNITAPPEISKGYISKGRIRGWQFMKEFVHVDGTVFHKGVEQPKLKGTLPPTPKPEPKKKLSKQEKQTLKNKLAEQMVFIRGELGKAKLKKDIRSNQSSLRKIERQLKKLI